MRRLPVILAVLLLAWPGASRGADPGARPTERAAAAPTARDDAAAARRVVEAFHGVLLGCMREARALGLLFGGVDAAREETGRELAASQGPVALIGALA